MSTLSPSMEAITIPGSISGTAIINDLCRRIADKLARDCSLRSVDIYSGYSYKLSLEIQLADVYPQAVNIEITQGRIDPKLDVEHIELSSEVVAREPEPNNLERPVESEAASTAPTQDAITQAHTRFYTPRGATPKPLR